MIDLKNKISANTLKIIAVITMIIDHIGAYMYPELTQDTYYILRSIGRISMPLFAYLLVQGYMYTKNVYKYIFRLFILATITQISLLILGYINNTYYIEYTRSVSNYLCVIYSYVLSLILLLMIDKKIILKKFNQNINLFIRINSIFIIIALYYFVKIEFDYIIPFLIIEIYVIEKIFEKDGMILLQNVDNKLFNKKKIIYCLLLFICFTIITFLTEYNFCNKYYILLSLLFIFLYNGKRGCNNKIIKYTFYLVYPIQHIILYLYGMIVLGK